ncbi:transporter [Hymenobacter algoricola]|uniref:Transporter n=1 Tax=Hymenobacter algoricola TaxID=486267 RepID=A0ABP7MIQ6_9BACT
MFSLSARRGHFSSLCFAGRGLLLAAGMGLPLLTQAQDTGSTPAQGRDYTLFRPVPRDSLQELRPDRPGVSESPFTVDPGHFQVESDLLRLLNKRAPDHRERDLHFNHVLLKLGLTMRTDVQVQLDSYSWQKQWNEQQQPERRQGFGDLTVRVKRSLAGEHGKPDALAVMALVRLPVGSAVGTRAAEYGLMVPYSHDFSKELNVQIQLRSELNYDDAASRRFVLLGPSTAIDYEFSPFWSAFAEVAGQWDVRQTAWQASVNVGPQLHLSNNLILDGGAHLALTPATDHEYFLGFSFRH